MSVKDVVRWASPEDKIERRPHDRYRGRSQMGKSTVHITCPFCGEETEAYLWSLAGSGKRCPCGALHGAYGSSIHWKQAT